MLGTEQMKKVLRKESAKLLKKFDVDEVYDLDVYMKVSKKKADYFVFLTSDVKGADNTNVKFSLKKSLKKTIKKGLCGALKVILAASANAKKVDIKDKEKAVKKYLAKRQKPMLKALK